MPDELTAARLAETYRRAARIRQRRLVVGGSVAVAVLALAGVAGVAWPGGGGDEVRTVAGPDGDATTTTVPPDTVLDTTTTQPAVTGTTEPGMVTTTTAKPRSGGVGGTSAAATTTTTKACRNSHDPACGPFRWDPHPVNGPMAVEVSMAPPAPKNGEEVVFTVRVRDDGPVRGGCINQQEYGDGSGSGPVCTAACVGAPRYGPWDPPPPDNPSLVEEFRHSYAGPGTYTARFAYNVGSDCSFTPYRSTGEASLQVTVTP